MGHERRYSKPAIPTVAIVGVGPRGLYCLEALIAEYRARPLCNGLHVAIFNQSSRFGTSPVYDPDQPPYLLANARVKELNLWNSDGSAATEPAGAGFLSWHYVEFQPPAPLDPETYPPRAIIGQYLFHGFQQIVSQLPPEMRLSKFIAEVTDIVPGAHGYRVKFTGAEGRRGELSADKVLLTTGHPSVRLARRERHYRQFTARHPGISFVPQVYPVAEKMDRVPAGARVAMKGMGLTFIDAILALTEGRGGVFSRESDGRLRYQMSGLEPKTIIPFSRSGLPMAPKPRDFPHVPRPLTFITTARLVELRQRSRDGKLDLDKDIWPQVELDMELRYYEVAMDDDRDRKRLAECGDDVQAMRQVVREFLKSHTDQKPFHYCQILDPVGNRHFPTAAEYNSFVARYLQQEIDYACVGMVASPARAAVSAWFEIRAALKPFVAYGGLTPESHRRLIEWYFPRFKRVVFGPAIVNMEKILALHRAGIVDFSYARNPRMVARESAGCFELTTDISTSAAARVEILIDARYPQAQIPRDMTPLYRNLRRRKMIREFENTSAEAAENRYSTGAIDIGRVSHNVIDHNGTANLDIAASGAQAENNLIGTFTIIRDGYETVWATDVLSQLRGTRTVMDTTLPSDARLGTFRRPHRPIRA